MKRVPLVFLLTCTAVAQNAPLPTPVDIRVHHVDVAVWLDLSLLEVAPHTAGHFAGQVILEKEGWFTAYYSHIGYAPEFGPKEVRFTVSNASRSDLVCKGRDEISLSFAEGSPP
jgi:hypothetical protein